MAIKMNKGTATNINMTESHKHSIIWKEYNFYIVGPCVHVQKTNTHTLETNNASHLPKKEVMILKVIRRWFPQGHTEDYTDQVLTGDF